MKSIGRHYKNGKKDVNYILQKKDIKDNAIKKELKSK